MFLLHFEEDGVWIHSIPGLRGVTLVVGVGVVNLSRCGVSVEGVQSQLDKAR